MAIKHIKSLQYSFTFLCRQQNHLNYTINIHYTGKPIHLYRWAWWRRKKGYVKNSWVLSVCSGNKFCVNRL